MLVGWWQTLEKSPEKKAKAEGAQAENWGGLSASGAHKEHGRKGRASANMGTGSDRKEGGRRWVVLLAVGTAGSHRAGGSVRGDRPQTGEELQGRGQASERPQPQASAGRGGNMRGRKAEGDGVEDWSGAKMGS